MNTRQFGITVIGILLIASLVLAACQPAAPTPDPAETIVITQIVEGTPQIIVVTPTPDPAVGVPTPPGPPVTGPIPADEMVACNPLPQMAHNRTNTTSRLASLTNPANLWAALPAPPARVSQQVTPEGDYLVGVFEDITTLNFWAANGPDNTVWNAFMLPGRLSLFILSDRFFTYAPSVAAINEVPPLTQDGEFWIVDIPIREDIVWSDGTPFTANDVAFTGNTVVEIGLISGNWSSWYDSNYLERIEAVDDFTVRFVYHTQPGLSRHEYGTLVAPILAAHYWEPIVEEALADVRALGDDPAEGALFEAQGEAQSILFAHDPRDNGGEPTAGAYLLDRWEPGASVILTANPDFFMSGVVVELWEDGSYRTSEGIEIGQPSGEPDVVMDIGPHFESIIYSLYGTQDAAILALRQGEVDFALNSLGLQRGLEAQLFGDPNLDVLENPTNGFRYIAFNNRRMPMNYCAFRQAVAVLIDKEFVTNTILQGVAFPLYTFVPEANAAWFYDNVPMLGQGLDRGQRIDLAIQILEEGGFSWEGDQRPTFDPSDLQVVPGGRLVMPNGQPMPDITLIAPSPGYDPLRSTFAIWIETWLREAGIPITAELSGFNTLVPRIYSEQDFDIFMLGWSLGIFPDHLYDFFSEEQAVLEGNNAGGYINPEFEELGRTLIECKNFEECKVIADRMQEILAEEVPYVVLFDTGIIEAYHTQAIQFPFTEQLSGLQYTHRGGFLEPSIKPGAE
jgi:peptide/nickel transport system substrate-binding protein